MNSIKLKIKVQATLCTAYDVKDNGDFVFVVCRRGLSQLLGRRLKSEEEFVVDILIKEIES